MANYNLPTELLADLPIFRAILVRILHNAFP